MNLRYDTGMIAVLWQRDLRLFFRQKSRVLGALAPPLLLWLAIGAGIAPRFSVTGGVDYMEYFFPGVIFILLLNLSITATMSVIEDRRQRFLQGVLVAPGGRWAMVLGKTLGSASVALLHAGLFLLLAPWAGFAAGTIQWGSLLLVMTLTSLALTGTGFMLAWWLNSVQGYHVVMSLVLFPLWILSGAMFPTDGLHPVMRTLCSWNPMSYAMAALRRALYGGTLPEGIGLPGSSTALELGVLLATTTILLLLACRVAGRRAAV